MKFEIKVTGQKEVPVMYGNAFVLVEASSRNKQFSFSVDQHNAKYYYIGRKISMEVLPQ